MIYRQNCIVLFLVLISSSKAIWAQNVYFSAEESIKEISVNEDGRIHLLGQSMLCELEGERLATECLQLPDNITKILPYKDDHYFIIGKNIITEILNHQVSGKYLARDLILDATISFGHLYLGTAGQGVEIINLQSLTLDTILFENEFVNSIEMIGDQMWMGLDNRLVIRDNRTLELSEIPMSIIVEIIEPFGDNVFVGSFDGHACCVNRQSHELIYKDINHRILEASSSLGEIVIRSDSGILKVDHTLQLEWLQKGEYDCILALNNVLLYGKNNHIYSLDLSTKLYNSLLPVFAIEYDSNQISWIGTIGQFQKWQEDEVITSYTIPSSLTGIKVSAIQKINDELWVGTMGDGIFVFSESGTLRQHLKWKSQDPENNIVAIKSDHDHIFIAYLTGVMMCNAKGDVVRKFNNISGKNYIYCLLTTGNEDFLIGTAKNGVIEHKKGHINQYLKGRSITSLTSFGDGYLGADKTGIFHFNSSNNGELVIDVRNTQILSSIDSNILVATKQQAYLYDAKLRKKATIDLETLTDVQLNASVHNQRYIYIGLKNGMLRLDSKRKAQIHDIKLHLNTPKLFSQKVTSNRTNFNYNQNSFSFSFHPSRSSIYPNVIYKYRLVGLDTSWQLTQQSKSSFFNLPPGEYVFEVAGALDRAFTPTLKETYQFTINKPIWQRTWFIIITAILCVLGVAFVVRKREIRIRLQESLHREKLKHQLTQLQEQVNPHFLFNALNSLIGLVEEDPHAASKTLERLSDLYRNIVKYQNIETVDLSTELELAKQYFELHKLRFEDLITLDLQVTPSQGISIIPLSCQILIENAIKHNVINATHPLHIRVRIDQNHLIVENNLSPKHGLVPSENVGLDNLRKRYSMLTELPLSVSKTETSFVVKLPLIYD